MVFKLRKRELVVILFFILYSLFWVFIQIQQFPEHHFIVDIFSNTYCLMALLGGVIGMFISHQWGGLKSIMGKAIAAFSLGLFFQLFGQISYTYMSDFLKIEVPYPSIGDVGYFGSVLFYIIGAFLFSQVCGVIFTLNSLKGKIKAVLIPLTLLSSSYYLFLKGYVFDYSKLLTIFLDFGYPLGQSIYISITLAAFFLTRDMLGGLMKKKVLYIFVALLVQYLADFNFLFQNSRGTWVYAGYGDYLYFLAYFIMTLSILQLNIAHNELKMRPIN